MILFTLMVGLEASKGIRDRCPSNQLLYPCFCNSIPKMEDQENCTGIRATTYQCQSPVISCIGSGLTQIRSIFTNLTTITQNVRFRKFEWFYLVDDQINSLDNDLFAGLYFRNVYLQNCPKLLVIRANAFGESGDYVENIFINASRLSNNGKLRRATFIALSSLSNLQVLEIQQSSITAIPFKAFNRDTNVRIIRFYNPDARQKLKKIGTRAFYKANKVEEIDLKNNQIAKINRYAFQFNQPAIDQELRVFLSGNRLHSDSFDRLAFNGGNGRNVVLYLGDYDNCNSELTTLSQQVFEPFLLENRANIIDMYGCPLICDHKMEWLTNNIEQYRIQIRNLICFNQTSFENSAKYSYYNLV